MVVKCQKNHYNWSYCLYVCILIVFTIEIIDRECDACTNALWSYQYFLQSKLKAVYKFLQSLQHIIISFSIMNIIVSG